MVNNPKHQEVYYKMLFSINFVANLLKLFRFFFLIRKIMINIYLKNVCKMYSIHFNILKLNSILIFIKLININCF